MGFIRWLTTEGGRPVHPLVRAWRLFGLAVVTVIAVIGAVGMLVTLWQT